MSELEYLKSLNAEELANFCLVSFFRRFRYRDKAKAETLFRSLINVILLFEDKEKVMDLKRFAKSHYDNGFSDFTWPKVVDYWKEIMIEDSKAYHLENALKRERVFIDNCGEALNELQSKKTKTGHDDTPIDIPANVINNSPADNADSPAGVNSDGHANVNDNSHVNVNDKSHTDTNNDGHANVNDNSHSNVNDYSQTEANNDSHVNVNIDVFNDNESTYDINNEEEYWTAWIMFLSQLGQFSHTYSLEKYNIIECGYTIKCHGSIPLNFYQHLCLAVMQPINIFQECSGLMIRLRPYIYGENTNNEEIPNIIYNNNNYPASLSDVDKLFMKTFLYQLTYQKLFLMFPISSSEINYNHALIWPCFQATIKSMQHYSFELGEYTLKSFKTVDGEGYKADGAVLYDDHELLILETSGEWGNNDSNRHGYDHIKGAFGLLAMFRAIVYKYHYASIDEVMKLRLLFVQARGTKLHLWMLEMPKVNLFMMNRIADVEVKQEYKTSADILLLGDFLLKLRLALNICGNSVRNLRSSHNNRVEDNMLNDGCPLIDLRKIIQPDPIPKPPRTSGYGPLLPSSDLGIFSSYTP